MNRFVCGAALIFLLGGTALADMATPSPGLDGTVCQNGTATDFITRAQAAGVPDDSIVVMDKSGTEAVLSRLDDVGLPQPPAGTVKIIIQALLDADPAAVKGSLDKTTVAMAVFSANDCYEGELQLPISIVKVLLAEQEATGGS